MIFIGSLLTGSEDRFWRLKAPKRRVSLAIKKASWPLNGSYPDHFHEIRNAENIDNSPQVVGQHVQAHFRPHMFKGLHQEVSRPHPELERTEDMLNGTPSLFHLPRISVQTILHCIQNAFMLPSPDPPFLASGALCFQRTLAAG